ncbi:uncharacterized protein LOC141633983 [Silene latifolia]|uniref:uncharacterized protein LOC141633983 n=1 Tax=Silene latifolia TaxID=37657 RepID=UPI003D7866E3
MADVFNLLLMYDDDDDFNGPIVDYGDDDIAMSPDPESMREVEQRTVIGNVVDSPQLSAHADVDDVSDEDRKDIDPLLDAFLPPPPQDKCLDELQQKINKFLAYKRQGKSFNVEVRNRKNYRNPDFLRHAVSYLDIDEIGLRLHKSDRLSCHWFRHDANAVNVICLFQEIISFSEDEITDVRGVRDSSADHILNV